MRYSHIRKIGKSVPYHKGFIEFFRVTLPDKSCRVKGVAPEKNYEKYLIVYRKKQHREGLVLMSLFTTKEFYRIKKSFWTRSGKFTKNGSQRIRELKNNTESFIRDQVILTHQTKPIRYWHLRAQAWVCD